jgi:hypothetical protein
VKRVWRWFSQRPFLAALLGAAILIAPAYVRQERAIDEAHQAAIDADEAADDARDTAAALAQLVLQVEQDRLSRRQELCRRDVADRLDDRALWEEAFILFEGAPEVAQLRETLEERLPLLECSVDGVPHPRD